MSSYNKRKKEYAKKVLEKHVSSYRIDDRLETKYGIITKRGITEVDDVLLNYITKKTGITSLQAIDLIIDEYEKTKKKRDIENERRGYKVKDYIERRNDAHDDYMQKSLKSREKLFKKIERYHNGGVFNLREDTLLEALDILVEDYGIDEDEAIKILEDYIDIL